MSVRACATISRRFSGRRGEAGRPLPASSRCRPPSSGASAASSASCLACLACPACRTPHRPSCLACRTCRRPACHCPSWCRPASSSQARHPPARRSRVRQ
ncbi:hypothetical protein SI859A1_01291 [Aurantimonas manganoxydans SI85-9A1]|uniref:Uncharacterized protein n=1 Tax=Aurantimonas manganoxydans (strain ATCC BAA-1229 / DSM 21871 / SI85-9A1) TaxID=287752 RepID=Q1YJ29_AURMS|nr:hypothetical protein SI859A1_01291 [Aurantimonas manganoxydans SI85-9A1]